MIRVGHALIKALDIAMRKDNTWRTCVDESGHAVLLAAFKNIESALVINALIFRIRLFNASLGSCMKDHVTALHGLIDEISI
jgi:hypothetical protein